MKKAFLASICALLFMVFVGWYSGLNMLERGNEQAVTLLCGLMFAFGIFIMFVPTHILMSKRDEEK